MSNLITHAALAELYDATGNTLAADIQRWQDTPDPEAVTADELADAIDADLVNVEASKAHEKHNGEQWTKCAACLADRIGEKLWPS